MNAIYLDCFAGISGNMLLGAFLDGNVPVEYLKQELSKLNIDNEFSLKISYVQKQGIRATYVDVDVIQHSHCHDHHGHDNGHHHHSHAQQRNLQDILQLIHSSNLEDNVKTISEQVFRSLAAAEAKVHGKLIDEVHFHEVGAVDSIVDIVGTAICLSYLDIKNIYVSNLNVGSGFINCAHGVMPVPAPATAELLCGLTSYSQHAQRELVTPTGAAVVAALANGQSADLPSNFKYKKVSYGAGTWDLTIPNVLRLYLGEISAQQMQKKNF